MVLEWEENRVPLEISLRKDTEDPGMGSITQSEMFGARKLQIGEEFSGEVFSPFEYHAHHSSEVSFSLGNNGRKIWRSTRWFEAVGELKHNGSLEQDLLARRWEWTQDCLEQARSDRQNWIWKSHYSASTKYK